VLKSVKKLLPHSPTKKVFVTSMVARALSPSLLPQHQTMLSNGSTGSLSDETVLLTVEFYERDDISRLSPKQRDFLKMNVDGQAIQVQKVLLQLL
jgi:hypothetical protein